MNARRTFRRDVLLPVFLGAVIFALYAWALRSAGDVVAAVWLR